MSIRLQSTVVFRTIWLFLNRFGGNPIDHFKLHFTLFHTFVEEASFFTGVLSVLVTVALLTLKNMFQEVMSFFWQSRSEGLLKGHLPSSSQYPDICHVCRMEGRNDWGISYLACKEDPTTGFCQQNNFWYHWLSTWCDNIIKACKMSLIVLVLFQEMTPGSLSHNPHSCGEGGREAVDSKPKIIVEVVSLSLHDCVCISLYLLKVKGCF